MMETETVEKTEFKFSELSPEAQDHAIEKRRAIEYELWEPDYEIEHFETICKHLGITLDYRTYQTVGGKQGSCPDISYSVASCQGDGAVFKGTWHASHMQVHELQGEVGDDSVIHTYAAKLMAVMLRYPDASCTIAHSGRGDPICNNMRVNDCETGTGTEMDDDLVDVLDDVMKLLAVWLYDSLRDDLEYRTSDEGCREYLMDSDGDQLYDEDGDEV